MPLEQPPGLGKYCTAHLLSLPSTRCSYPSLCWQGSEHSSSILWEVVDGPKQLVTAGGFCSQKPPETCETCITYRRHRIQLQAAEIHTVTAKRTAVRLADTAFLVTSNLHTFATATTCPAFSFSSSASASAASWASCTAS